MRSPASRQGDRASPASLAHPSLANRRVSPLHSRRMPELEFHTNLNGGDAAEILPRVYQELRKLAAVRMGRESGPQTLSATSLVHEAYLRVAKDEDTAEEPWSSRRHFFGAAAEAMRRILIDRARARQRIKRGGEQERLDLSISQIVTPAEEDQLLAVHEALEELERVDAESAELVKLRYFAGMTWEEISVATDIPDRTLRRQWSYARSWLKEWMNRDRNSS